MGLGMRIRLVIIIMEGLLGLIGFGSLSLISLIIQLSDSIYIDSIMTHFLAYQFPQTNPQNNQNQTIPQQIIPSNS